MARERPENLKPPEKTPNKKRDLGKRLEGGFPKGDPKQDWNDQDRDHQNGNRPGKATYQT